MRCAATIGVATVVAGLGGTCAPAPAARASIDEIVAVVRRAAEAAPPGVPAVGGDAPGGVGDGLSNFSESMPSAGWSVSNDGRPFCAHSEVRRFAWSGAVAGARFGAPEVAIAQAEAEAAVLAEAGFIAIDAGSTEFHGSQGGASEFQWSVKSADGLGTSRATPRPSRLVHRRIYHAPGTSAFVLTRIDYEAAGGVATVEISCFAGDPGSAAARPSLRVPVRETLTALPRR